VSTHCGCVAETSTRAPARAPWAEPGQLPAFGVRQGLIRTVALAALSFGVLYLVWRAVATMAGAPLWLTLPLYGAELCAWLSLAGFTFIAWTVRPSRRPALRSCLSVDVLVPTYDEGDEVLRPTLLGCLGLSHPHVRIHLLDDGRRAWVAELAAELGVQYHTRPNNAHAKAGNINAALPALDGDLVLILDADHVPQVDLLAATLGYFEDPDVAFVQTPHEFYNADSVQHTARDEHDQSLFYRVIQPGRDAHGGAFWCGSGAVIRRRALEAVGGLATETITEDFHTSLKLHKAGWQSRFHNEPLVFGIAPQNIAQFLLQRDRWVSGNLAALRTRHSPLTAGGLGLRRRLCYLIGLFEVSAAPQRIVVIGVLAATITTGDLPLNASLSHFLPIFCAWAVTSVAAAILLSRGHMSVLNAVRFEYFTLPSRLRGIASLVRPNTQFRVTPKDGIDEGGLTWVRHNVALAALIVVLIAAFAWRGLGSLGYVPAHHLGAGTLAVVLVLGVVELTRLVDAAVSLSRHRQRRTAYRFPTALRGELQGRPCTVEDLSSSGCAVKAGSLIELADHVDLELDLGAFGWHSFVVEHPRLTEPERTGPRIQGPLRPRDDAARNALAATLFVLGPTLERIGDDDVRDERAATLAERLRTVGVLGIEPAFAASALQGR
jgi:cellulose synthase (UDP-forming)